jgi:hypothetical protein
VAIVSLKLENRIHVVVYLLWDRVRKNLVPNWPFSKRRREWLYDEIDIAPNNRDGFVHRILFSDGEVLEVPFLTTFTSAVEVAASAKNGRSRRSA